MIDGIKATCIIEDYAQWIKKTQLSFKGTYNIETGEPCTTNNIKGQRRFVSHYFTSFETYKLRLIKTEVGNSFIDIVSTSYRLIIIGSLHKNLYRIDEHPNGANFAPFTFSQLQAELINLETKLHIDLNKMKIQNIEIGVNIPFEYDVLKYLDNNLLAYKNKTFDRWHENGRKSIGYDCEFANYKIKIYDKALQFKLPHPLLRFEIKVKRMIHIKEYGIKVLSDLKEISKVDSLLTELIKPWSYILMIDPNITDDLIEEDLSFITSIRDINFWRQLDKNQRFKTVDRFRQIHIKHGSTLTDYFINSIATNWSQLLNN